MKVTIAVSIGRSPAGHLTWNADGSSHFTTKASGHHVRACFPTDFDVKVYTVDVEIPETFNETPSLGEAAAKAQNKEQEA